VLHLTWASDAVAGPQSRCGFTYRLTGDQLLAARRLKSAVGERSRTSDEMFIERCGGTLGYGRDRTDGMVGGLRFESGRGLEVPANRHLLLPS
jgi:hypothetical protein